jgi:hypothetical protein
MVSTLGPLASAGPELVDSFKGLCVSMRTTKTTDRRRAPRDSASPNVGQLRRDSGDSNACVLNISETGALIASPSEPSIGEFVWVSFDEPMATDSLRGRVVRLEQPSRVGIAFEEPCPFEIHRSLTLGVSFNFIASPFSAPAP